MNTPNFPQSHYKQTEIKGSGFPIPHTLRDTFPETIFGSGVTDNKEAAPNPVITMILSNLEDIVAKAKIGYDQLAFFNKTEGGQSLGMNRIGILQHELQKLIINIKTEIKQ